jgi:NADH dehydrogenase
VAAAFAAALAEPRAIGRTLDLCGPEALSLVALLDTILSVLGRRRVKLHIPLPLARAQAAMLELVWPRLLGCAAPLNRDQLLMLQEDNVGDPGPAAKLFDLKLAPFREGIGAWLGR